MQRDISSYRRLDTTKNKAKKMGKGRTGEGRMEWGYGHDDDDKDDWGAGC